MRINDFNLKHTLECGQCFNFERIRASETDEPDSCSYEYNVFAKGKCLNVIQEGREVVFRNASQDEAENIWVPYFDLNRDYGLIKDAVKKADPALAPVIDQYYGIRILNQDFVETLMSFIISQNKSIPQIRQLVKRISDTYGITVEGGYNAFPELKQLEQISEEDFRAMKTGFRAPYLRDAVERLSDGRICEKELRSMDFQTAKNKLMEIRGVGDKVANCVLLFGLGFRNAFPVDVWIKRIMEELYFHKDTDKKVIEKFALEKFGEYGGYAQQYLFIYAKNKM